MDGITQLIVDLLRKKQEEAALNRGGLTAGTPQQQAAARFGAQVSPAEAARGLPPQRPPASTPPFAMPVGREPKHGGKTYEQILAEMGG